MYIVCLHTRPIDVSEREGGLRYVIVGRPEVLGPRLVAGREPGVGVVAGWAPLGDNGWSRYAEAMREVYAAAAG